MLTWTNKAIWTLDDVVPGAPRVARGLQRIGEVESKSDSDLLPLLRFAWKTYLDDADAAAMTPKGKDRIAVIAASLQPEGGDLGIFTETSRGDSIAPCVRIFDARIDAEYHELPDPAEDEDAFTASFQAMFAGPKQAMIDAARSPEIAPRLRQLLDKLGAELVLRVGEDDESELVV